jgi:parallel beta-helix repeat protein
MLKIFIQINTFYRLLSGREILRSMLAFFLALTFSQLEATNYYFSNRGSDSGNTGLSAISPWKSLEKLNEIMISLQPGDSIFFRRGDVFHGEVRISQSGTKQSVIYLGAYGIGEKPVFDGTVRVTGWNAVAPNKWESANSLQEERLTNFFINGKKQPIGRWPNATTANQGYLSMKWASGSTRLSSKSIPDASVWQDGDLVVRTNRWLIDWSPIVETRGDTLTIRPCSYNIDREFGFFIKNHPRTLDRPGEWYFNRKSHKIMFYSVKNPEALDITVPIIESLVSIPGQKYITIENLVLKGSLGNALVADRSANITIRNSEFIHSGENAVLATKCYKLLFEGNKVLDANNLGIEFQSCNGTVVRQNTIKNVGINPAVGSNGISFIGIGIEGVSNLLEYNRIDSIGYIGLRFDGDSTVVRYNVISNTNMVKDDGGGIYTWNGDRWTNVSRKIIGNIVWNSLGAGCGTNDSLSVSAEGIYIDGGSNDVEITGNTVYNCANIGLFINNASKIVARNNLIYNCKSQLQVRAEGMPLGANRMNVVKNNTFVARTSSQRIANFISDEGVAGIKRLGAIDSNYYCRPADPDMIMHCSYKSESSDVRITYSLKEWQKQYGFDQHSLGEPVRYGYKVNSLGTPRKITYGFYHEGKDTWYDEKTTEKEALKNAIADLTGNSAGSQKGMNKYLILAMNIDFKKGEKRKYLLRFDTKGGKAGEVIKANFKTRDNQIICSREFQLKADFQRNEILYVPAFANTPFERVNFEFSDPQSSVWIKNISFQEADVTLPNLNDRFLLMVNESNSPQAYPIKKGFVDVAGKVPAKSVVLQSYSSSIFFKK